MIKLSICIPTYNRCEYLRNAINSIIKQINDKETEECVEIVISDNCSNDSTAGMIAEIKNKHPNLQIVYSVADKNHGADRNYIRAVSLANGEYCWFLGSDDKIADGSLKRILNEIKEGHTVFLFNYYESGLEDIELEDKNKFIFRRVLKSEVKDDEVFYFKNEKDWDFFLNRCNNTNGLFGFISVLVFKRKIWNKVIINEKLESFIGSAFVHVAILLYMLKICDEATLKYLSTPLIIYRPGNDSFFNGVYKRIMLDIDGYIQLSNIFEDYSFVVVNDIRLIVNNTHPLVDWRMVLFTKKYQFDNLISKLELIGYREAEIENLKRARRWRWLSFLIVFLSELQKPNELYKKIYRKIHKWKL